MRFPVHARRHNAMPSFFRDLASRRNENNAPTALSQFMKLKIGGQTPLRELKKIIRGFAFDRAAETNGFIARKELEIIALKLYGPNDSLRINKTRRMLMLEGLEVEAGERSKSLEKKHAVHGKNPKAKNSQGIGTIGYRQINSKADDFLGKKKVLKESRAFVYGKNEKNKGANLMRGIKPVFSKRQFAGKMPFKRTKRQKTFANANSGSNALGKLLNLEITATTPTHEISRAFDDLAVEKILSGNRNFSQIEFKAICAKFGKDMRGALQKRGLGIEKAPMRGLNKGQRFTRRKNTEGVREKPSESFLDSTLIKQKARKFLEGKDTLSGKMLPSPIIPKKSQRHD